MNVFGVIALSIVIAGGDDLNSAIMARGIEIRACWGIDLHIPPNLWIDFFRDFYEFSMRWLRDGKRDEEEWRRFWAVFLSHGACDYCPSACMLLHTFDVIETIAATLPVSRIHQAFNENGNAAGLRLKGYMASQTHWVAPLPGEPEWPLAEVGAVLRHLLAKEEEEVQWAEGLAAYLAEGPAARVYVAPSPVRSNIQRRTRVRLGQLLTAYGGNRVDGLFMEVVRHLERLREHLGLNFDIRIEREIPFFPVRGTLLGLLRYGSVYGELPEGTDFIDARAKNRFEFAVVLPTIQDRFPAAVALTAMLLNAGWEQCWLQSHSGAAFQWSGQVDALICSRNAPIHEVGFDFLTSEGAAETQELFSARACPKAWPDGVPRRNRNDA